MTIKIDERDDNAQSWLMATVAHRAFGGGWRKVQEVCGNGQNDTSAEAILPPMAIELRKDKDGNFYQQSIDLYQRRVGLTILTNFYARTAMYMTGLVFSGANWDEAPEALRYLVEDANTEGTSATQFFAWQFYKDLIEGVRCCYVNSTKPAGKGQTLATEDKKNGYRVRFSDVSGENILGGRGGTSRLLSVAQEPDGDWGWKEVKKVYVVSTNEIGLYEKSSDKGDFVAVEGYPLPVNTKGSPAVFLTLGGKIGAFHGVPVLDDLAGIQLDHLRTSSLDNQYREGCNWLWVHSHGYDLTGGTHGPLTAWTAGNWEEDPINKTMKFNQYAGNHPPFIKIAEATGNVAKFNKERLEEAKNNAALWGMAQLRPDGVSFSTATSWNVTQKSTTSSLSMWAETMENYIWTCFKRAGEMEGVQVPVKPCTLEKDYSNVDIGQLAAYLQFNAQGVISKETLFNTLKNSGGVATSNDWTTEQQDINDENIQSSQTSQGVGGVEDILGGTAL